MSALVVQHAAAIAFFAALLLFERVRRSPALAIVRHPMYAYLARAAITAAYLALVGLDPRVWLDVPAAQWLLAAALLVVGLASMRRRDVVFLVRNTAMAVQATYLAAMVAFVEELIFRGAFVLAAAVTPETTVLASAGASAAYVVWRAVTYRDRNVVSLTVVFAVSIGLGLLAAASRSLWPAVVVHGAYVLLAGPPRAPVRARATPSAARP